MRKNIWLSFALILLLFNIASATSTLLPQTGQTLCYSESGSTSCSDSLFPGQDGSLKSGLAWGTPRFIDNSANNVDTIADTLTNLVWTKDANAPEPSVGLCTTSDSMTWQQALNYVKCLNTNNYLGAHDWALPNVNQLTSLINLQQTQNTQWLTTAGFTDVQAASYWTNDTFVADPLKAWAVAINGSGTIQDDKLTNNHAWPVRIAADLVITSVIAPATAVTGQQVTIPVTVKNIGSGSTTGSSGYVYLYLSTDSTITTSDTLLSNVLVAPLAPGAESTYNFSVMLSPYLTSGTYYIGAIADKLAYIPESDETNNVTAAATATAITYGPDLVVSPPFVTPAAAVTGQQVTIPVTVKNIGSGSTTGSSGYVYLYLSTDSTITTSDTLLCNVLIAPLAPGAESTHNCSGTPWTSGTYYIGAIADRAAYIAESNETNNVTVAATTTAITYGADLVVSSVIAPATAVTGQQVTIPVMVKNIGSGSTPSGSNVYLYLSTDSTITTSDTSLSNILIPTLAAGAEFTYDFSVTLPSGTYYIGAIADRINAVAESDETNNSKAADNPTEITP